MLFGQSVDKRGFGFTDGAKTAKASVFESFLGILKGLFFKKVS